MKNQILETCLEIVHVDNTVLRTKTKEVGLQQGVVIGQYLIKILKQHQYVRDIENGLSAPQIGEQTSVFVTSIEGVYKIYINPRILQRSKELILYKESCVNCIPLLVNVNRSKSIHIEYTDEYGNFNILEIEGFLAQIFQHQCDHLEGILNIEDNIS